LKLLELTLCIVVDFAFDGVTQFAWQHVLDLALDLAAEKVENEGDVTVKLDVHIAYTAAAAPRFDGRSSGGVFACV